ncbi:DUF6263 family protein [Muriicola marianensis]|uniref:DUF4412 domain-containing protein n=1 Tax=Muriicola marianensis TaxID=1324801 RepID=A0ABQ1R5H9_9FLAO|nr:DUF6263 family protein [Muriicola marianensis]GGD58977.1 hypothetical protein GCM10011361_26700 [Muriicola marianensis]
MHLKTLAFFVSLLVFSPFSNAQEKLQYKLKKGDVFHVRQVARQDIVQEIDGAAHEVTNDLSGTLEFKVTGKTEDTYSIDITFQELFMKMTSSMQGVVLEVNAQDLEPDNVQSRIFHSLLNEPVHMTMRTNGDIVEVKGGDSIVAKMIRASGLQEAFAVNMLRSSLKNEFGSKALSDSYKQMTYIYPDKNIKVGDTWKNSYSGKLNANTLWKLDSLDGKKASISGTAEIVMKIEEPATTMVLDGTQNTSVTTDLRSGFILKMKVEGISKGYSTLAQMGTQKIPTTITSSITYELIQ